MHSGTRPIKVCRVASVDMTLLFLLMPQIKFLKEHGYDVSGVCSPGDLIPLIEQQGVRVKPIAIERKISPFSDLVALWRLFWYFRKERFDIVHTHTPKASFVAQIAAWLARVPVRMVTIHGMYVRKDSCPKLKWLVFSWAERIVALCCQHAFSINHTDLETLNREGIYKRDRITYLGTGVSLKRFDPSRFSLEFVQRKKRELGIPLNKNVVGVVARLVREKGYMVLFEAFRMLLREYPDTVLLVIGSLDPVKKDSVNPFELVKKYGIGDHAVILIQRFDMEELYMVMDVFTLPSFREGIGSSTLQASAMERPVVVSDILGCQEAVEGGKTGLLVSPGDPHALADALSWIFSHRAEAARMGQAGREKVARDFAEDLVFQHMLVTYERLVRGKLG